MSGVSLETCLAIKKHWNNKFYYTVASFGYFYKIWPTFIFWYVNKYRNWP